MFLKNTLRGFSLIELLVYTAIFGVISIVAFRSIDYFQKSQYEIQERQNMAIQINQALQALERSIYLSETKPKVFTGTTVSFTVNNLAFTNTSGRCLDLSNFSQNVLVKTSFWLGYDSGIDRYSIYQGKSSSCTSQPSSNNFLKLSDAIFKKRTTTLGFFIEDVNTTKIQINLIASVNKNKEYIENLNQTKSSVYFSKINDTGCRIAGPESNWFTNLPSSTYQYLFVIFSTNYDATKDKLTLVKDSDGSNASCSSSATTETVAGLSNIKCVFCNGNAEATGGDSTNPTTGNVCPTESTASGAARAKGFLYINAGQAINADNWRDIVRKINYAPLASMTVDPGSESSSKRLVTYLVSSDKSIMQANSNIGTTQGSMVLNLYQLSKSCTDSNFSN
jgi:prepilin-type N-terminal cleavage/methylation domain-containing protein